MLGTAVLPGTAVLKAVALDTAGLHVYGILLGVALGLVACSMAARHRVRRDTMDHRRRKSDDRDD